MQEINIKEGFPSALEAVKSLKATIKFAKSSKNRAIKIIHGYGSTGKGGKIRSEIRLYLKTQPSSRYTIFGEDFTIFNKDTLNAFIYAPDLRKDPDLEQCNQGITIIVF